MVVLVLLIINYTHYCHLRTMPNTIWEGNAVLILLPFAPTALEEVRKMNTWKFQLISVPYKCRVLLSTSPAEISLTSLLLLLSTGCSGCRDHQKIRGNKENRKNLDHRAKRFYFQTATSFKDLRQLFVRPLVRVVRTLAKLSCKSFH